jgi:hypothetical protein
MDGATHRNGTAALPPAPAAQDGPKANGHGARPGLPEWEAAIAAGPACLRANAPRFRVRARNAPRAALAALRRRGLDAAAARAGDTWIALYRLPDGQRPRAVFAMAGDADAPVLQLRWADMLPPGAVCAGPGGPFDAAAVEREIPAAARRVAQRRLGSSGLREVLRGAFWQREATLYSSTALVLSAFGFPMTDGVFVVGGVLLLLQGAARLGVHELRVAARMRALRRDPAAASLLRAAAARAVFARAHGIAGPDGEPRPVILRAQVAVPALCGAAPLKLLIDEDAAVTTGGPDAGGDGGLVADADGFALPASDNRLTVVFRRPRRPDLAADAAPDTAPARHGSDAAAARLPVPVGPLPAEEEIEVIDAELLDPEAYWGGPAPRGWWA